MTVWPAIVTVPLRPAPVLVAACTVTVPPPVPDVVPLSVKKLLLLVAFQLQGEPWVTVTVKLADPPPPATLVEGGETLNAHGCNPESCVTLTVWPAMVTEPLRELPVLAPTLTVTVPSLVPDAPPVTDRKPVLLTAVQLQPAPPVFVTVKVIAAPPAPTVVELGDTLNAHEPAAAACLTVRPWLAIPTPPSRATPVLAATLTVTVPLPVPDAPLAIDRKPWKLTASHAQPEPCVLVTEKVTDPLPAPTSNESGVTLNAHGPPAGRACVTVRLSPAMVTSPVRVAPRLRPTATVTVPSPAPEAPLAIDKKPVSLRAVHPQPVPTVFVTVKVTDPVASPTLAEAGVTLNSHGPGAACVTLTLVPAIDTSPVRGTSRVLVATATVTVPLPVPEAPPVTDRKFSEVVAVQPQFTPCVLVTVKLTDPAAAVTSVELGVTVNAQAAPSWVTVRVSPAMVTVPLRAAPVLAPAFTVTAPLPVPDAPAVIDRKSLLLEALQLQPAPCVFATWKTTGPPSVGMLYTLKPGATVNTHPLDTEPACVTVTGKPAMTSTAVRSAPALAVTCAMTVPLPLPGAPLVIVANGALLEAVQLQPAPCTFVTLIAIVAPPEATLMVLGETPKPQAKSEGAAWETITVWLAMVTVPDRPPPLFADAATTTVPLPVPEPPLLMLRKSLVAAAVQVQPDPDVAATSNDTEPPLEPTVASAGVTLNAHDPAASCRTVTLSPATVRRPEREPPVFAAALKDTVPGPLPVAPPVTLIHGVPLDALQSHPVEMETEIPPTPPSGPSVTSSGDTMGAHSPTGEGAVGVGAGVGDAANAAWVSVKVWPATTTAC